MNPTDSYVDSLVRENAALKTQIKTLTRALSDAQEKIDTLDYIIDAQQRTYHHESTVTETAPDGSMWDAGVE